MRISHSLLLILCLAGVWLPRGDAAGLNNKDLARALAASPLTEQEQILHVLNRLTYGPRPGDLQKVKSIGLAAYISRQLNPETIDDSAMDRQLEPLETLRMSSRELADRAQRRGNVQQLKPPQAQPEATNPLPNNVDGMRKIALELQQAKILRATYSERQLQEVMTDFWFNHFNVFMGKGADRILTTGYERDVIRPNALGNFHELLVATAKSPAMLFYLDNWMSVDPNARPPGRLFGLDSRRVPAGNNPDPAIRKGKRPRGLNENYARELMELHTLGVDGGYTQKDVTEVARCFTGWTLRNPKQGEGFQFDSFFHDNGEKTVLGKRIPPDQGIRDGEMVLEMLSQHPSTARFISIKLCRRFVSDDPPEALVRRCADTFLKSGGEIRQVLTTIFASPEFYARKAYRAKTKKPFELVVSALRATEAETTVPPQVLLSLRTMGEALYGCQPPTGYADTADAWINTGALLERVNFTTALAHNRLAGTRTRLEQLNGFGSGMTDLVARLSKDLLNDVPRKEFLLAAEKQIQAAEQNELPPDPRRKVAMIAGLILSSPEFQKR